MEKLILIAKQFIKYLQPKPAAVNYIQISFQHYNAMARVQVGYSQVTINSNATRELANMSQKQLRKWIKNYFSSFVGKGHCTITGINVGADNTTTMQIKKRLEGKKYHFAN